MTGEVVGYVLNETAAAVAHRRTGREHDGRWPPRQLVTGLLLSDEAAMELDALLPATEAVGGVDTFMDTMTAALEAVLIQQSLRLIGQIMDQFSWQV